MSTKEEKLVTLRDGSKVSKSRWLEMLGNQDTPKEARPKDGMTLKEFFHDVRGTRPEDDQARLEQQMRNTQNKQEGDTFEEEIRREAQYFLPKVDLVFIPARFKVWAVRYNPQKPNSLRSQLANILSKLWPKIKRIFIARPEASTWVDFIALWKGGSAHFDTKHTRTQGPSWRFGSHVETHQMSILKEQCRKGNAAFIYLRHYAGREEGTSDYIIPVFEDGFPFKAKTCVKWNLMAKWKMPRNALWFDAVTQWDDYKIHGWEGVELSTTKLYR